MQQQQHQHLKKRSLHRAFDVYQRIATAKQSEKLMRLRAFFDSMIDMEKQVLKAHPETNIMTCQIRVITAILSFLQSMNNMFSHVADHPKTSKKFVSEISKLSIRRMDASLKKLAKAKTFINALSLTDQDDDNRFCDAYLDLQYLSDKQDLFNTLKRSKDMMSMNK